MRKALLYIFILFLPAFAFGQVVKSAAVPYTKGSGFTPNIAGSSEIRIDTATSALYWWSRDALTWMRFRPGPDVITGGSAPAYTPRDNQSLFAVNADSELWYWDGAAWDQIGGGNDGNGIYGGSDTVPDGTVAYLLDDFEFAGPNISSFTVSTGTTYGGQYFSNFNGASVIYRDTSGNTALELSPTGAAFSFNGSGTDRLTIGGRDARYSADYSGSYSDRSLIDKGFADASYKSIYTGNGTLFSGGANVTFSGSNPLRFHRAGSSSTPIIQKIFSSGITGFFDRYVINSDSLVNFYALGRFGTLIEGSPYTFQVDQGEIFFNVDSVRSAGILTGTALKGIYGGTSKDVFYKIVGVHDGDILAWDSLSAHWEVRTGGGGGTSDHGALTGLSDDDHTQYALLAGRATGQTLTGGTASGDDLTLRSTTNATKGDVFIADQGGNVTIGGGATASELKLLEPSGSGTNYTAFKAQAQDGDITYTLPPNDGNASEYLKTDGSGSLTWAAAGDILNGGNTTGAAVTIGTNDAFGLNLETNNVTRMAITGGASTGGQVTVTNVTANTNTVSDGVTIQTNSTGTAAASFGGGILFQGESSTTDNQDMVRLSSIWTTATHASRASALVYSDVTAAGSLTERFRFTPTAMTTATGYTIGNSGNTLTIGGSNGIITLSTTSSNVSAIGLNANANSSGSTSGVTLSSGTTFTQTSGTRNAMDFSYGFAPTSGTAVHNQLVFSGTFNQTGGANGITRGIYLNQTLTAVADMRLLEIAANESNTKGVYQTGSSVVNNFVGATGFGATTTPTDKVEITGNLALLSAGNKIKIATGSNASVGTATLSSGTVTVNTTAVTTNSVIFVTTNTVSGTQGILSVPSASITNATSFVINSSNGGDNSTVNWWIVN